MLLLCVCVCGHASVQVHKQSKMLAVMAELKHEQDLEEILQDLEDTVQKRTWWRRLAELLDYSGS